MNCTVFNRGDVGEEPAVIEKAIHTTLLVWRRTPFSWANGQDCMLSLADYLMLLGYHDIGARFRGRYSTRRGCMRVSGFHRDPVKPLADCVAEIPLKVTEQPDRGDIGVVDSGGAAAGGLCIGKKWALRSQAGLLIGLPKSILISWQVTHV